MTIREKCLSKNFVPSPIPNGRGRIISLFERLFCKKITPAIKASAKKSHSQFVSGTDSFCLLSNNHFIGFPQILCRNRLFHFPNDIHWFRIRMTDIISQSYKRIWSSFSCDNIIFSFTHKQQFLDAH